MKDIFVIGLNELDHRWLKALPGAEEYRFHRLLTFAELQQGPDIPVERFIESAVKQLEAFDGTIDAIVSYWDFPGTLLAPILCKRFACHAPSLEAVLKCEHKYWSRLEQAQATDACPPFQAVDPYDDDALAKIKLDYPFWIKPVKAFLGQLSYRIRNEQDFYEHLPIIRRKLPRLGEPFTHVMRMADLPPEVAEVDGYHCVAEAELCGDRRGTIEGYMRNGKFHTYGVVESLCYPGTSVFSRLEYPSTLPAEVKQRLVEACEAVMCRIDLEDRPFNIEFFWDESSDKLSLLEINPRPSQSHSFAFEQVDGVSNLHVLIELAVGREPKMRHREGPFGCAAKFSHRAFRDGIVRRVPTAEEVRRVEERFPGTVVEITVREGDRLSDLLSQDAYSYLLAELMVAAENREAMLERYEQCLAMLPFEIEETPTKREAEKDGSRRASAA